MWRIRQLGPNGDIPAFITVLDLHHHNTREGVQPFRKTQPLMSQDSNPKRLEMTSTQSRRFEPPGGTVRAPAVASHPGAVCAVPH
jgi:hypothetical protein